MERERYPGMGFKGLESAFMISKLDFSKIFVMNGQWREASAWMKIVALEKRERDREI